MPAAHQGTLHIVRPADLPLELHIGRSFRHSYAPHSHEDFFVSAITGGAGRFRFRGRDYCATAGSLAMVVPGEIHAHDDSASGRSFRSLHLPWSLVEQWTSESPQPAPAVASSVFADRDLFGSFLELHRALQHQATRLEREGLLADLLGQLLRRAGQEAQKRPAGGESAAVRAARDFLHEHYDREVSLRELAAHVNLSPYYFHRAFRREAGLPPHAFQLQVRVMRAKGLLRQRLPLSSVAAQTGFSDQSHFTRHFKRLVGVTPGHYAG